MKLHILPIEPLVERYSAQWIEWFYQYLSNHPQIDYKFYEPYNYLTHKISAEIKHGQFLDILETNQYKTDQLHEILIAIEKKEVRDHDVILLHDGWFPGIEMLGYVRDCLGLKIKIVAMMHAGSYDPHDFLHQHGVQSWGADLENSWFSLYDKILVATHYHKELLIHTRKVNPDKINVVFFPMLTDWVKSAEKDKNLVVFPHRIAPEKQYELFEHLEDSAKRDGGKLKFITTKHNPDQSKTAYWYTLAQSTFAVSTALQETWGIAMIEAVLSGCVPIVPHRLSYKELYPPCFQYGDCSVGIHNVELIFQRLQTLIRQMEDPKSVVYKELEEVKNRFIVLGSHAIPIILNHCYTV